VTDTFDIIVQHKGEEKNFTGYLMHKVQSFQIKVLLNGIGIFYEPDEEGNFRIIITEGSQKRF
jgi:hypothetical protein